MEQKLRVNLTLTLYWWVPRLFKPINLSNFKNIFCLFQVKTTSLFQLNTSNKFIALLFLNHFNYVSYFQNFSVLKISYLLSFSSSNFYFYCWIMIKVNIYSLLIGLYLLQVVNSKNEKEIFPYLDVTKIVFVLRAL